MTFTCSACDRQLLLITNSEDEQSRIICECGVINQIDCADIIKKRVNVFLIKDKITKILSKDLFNTVNDELKNEIISNSPKIKTHAETSLVCFSILYLEYKNKLNFNPQYIVKKKQRKNIIKILIEIESKNVMKFIRTPITYIDTYSHLYTKKEYELYINISNCLMYLNSCNKKNMEKIYEKIHEVIISLRDESVSPECKRRESERQSDKNPEYKHDDITKQSTKQKNILKIDKSKKDNIKKCLKIPENNIYQIRGCNIKSIIKFIAISNLNINDLLEFENILITNNITNF